ncbi:MAG: hypothetical protein HYV97_18680 [Bdellovibrio sp.]|nr:hypothetical protein [Bdellovibrio sp.]
MPCKWKDYGEVESVIHYVSWWISQHYLDTEGKKAFREYLTLAGGILICDEPQDFDILITPKTPDKGAYKSIQSVKGTETRLYVSSDDSGSSIPRHTKCANRTEFEQLLRDWLENSDEETISNEAEYGKGDWIRVIDGASEYYLNADASREGIRTYLTLLDEHSTLPWSLVENNKGKMNKVVFGTAKTRITRFPLYLDL